MNIGLYYDFFFILSACLSCVYVYMWHKQFNVNLSLIFVLIPVANLGYVSSARANTLEEAIQAVQLTYLGGTFLILFITFYIFSMCQIRLPKWFSTGMVCASMAVYFTILSIGSGTLFYKEVHATKENGMIVLHKVYGPVHTVFYVLLGFYFVLSFSAILYSFFFKKQVSRRIIWLLFFPEVVTMVVFFGGRFFTRRFELTPAGYVFAQIMYLVIANYLCLYSVEDTAIDSLMETGDTGFIHIDSRMRYLGSNQIAREIFPELNGLAVDQSLLKKPRLGMRFSKWFETFNKDETKDKFLHSVQDKTYLVDINYLYQNSRKRGYQLVISDDTNNQKYISLIKNYNQNLEKEVKEKTQDIVKMHNNLIRSMAKLVESRDNSTGGHIIRTSDVVGLLMDEIMKDPEFTWKNQITPTFRDNLIKAAPLHDIGKIAVDDEVLRKPGRFTPEEFEQMKLHAPEGAKVLHSILRDTNDASFKVLAENVAHFHHERMDGSGYPDGLKGDAIPIEARIMAVADVYDALVSKRVYKDRMSFEKADSIMMESMGKHFDRRLEKYYIAARPGIEAYYRQKEEEEAQEEQA